jgi:hypothetical protein
MKTIEAQVRHMLAAELQVQETSLADDFRWLDEIGVEDSGYFLARLNDAFAEIPQGFGFGNGKLPFRQMEPETLEQIATVGGLIDS